MPKSNLLSLIVIVIVVLIGAYSYRDVFKPASLKEQQEARNVISVPLNKASYMWPANGIIVTKFDQSNKGIKISSVSDGAVICKDSNQVVSAKAGKVLTAGTLESSGGKTVTIGHDDGMITSYTNLSQISVKPGQTLGKGDIVGIMGTEESSGQPVLGFMVQTKGNFIDPITLTFDTPAPLCSK